MFMGDFLGGLGWVDNVAEKSDNIGWGVYVGKVPHEGPQFKHHQVALKSVLGVCNGGTVKEIVQHAVCFGAIWLSPPVSEYCLFQSSPWLSRLAGVDAPCLGCGAGFAHQVGPRSVTTS